MKKMILAHILNCVKTSAYSLRHKEYFRINFIKINIINSLNDYEQIN
jgi:hypothetical protein